VISVFCGYAARLKHRFATCSIDKAVRASEQDDRMWGHLEVTTHVANFLYALSDMAASQRTLRYEKSVSIGHYVTGHGLSDHKRHLEIFFKDAP
jgi:hypothetical protein